jgi:hypothetical protein
MAEKEKRIHHRAKFEWPASAKVDGKVIEGVTKDISPGGAYICCANSLKLNTVFDMFISAALYCCSNRIAGLFPASDAAQATIDICVP